MDERRVERVGGWCEVHCGDCLDVMAELEAESFAHVVTDPPYCSGGRQAYAMRGNVSKNGGRRDADWFVADNMGAESFGWWMREVARGCWRLVERGGHAYVFADWRQLHLLVCAWESVGWTQQSVIVWDKNRGGAMGSFWRNNHEEVVVFSKGKPAALRHRSAFNTWRGSKPQGHLHPTEKPLGLLEYIVGALPAMDSGRLLDAFCGSGTTLEAAGLHGFRAVGIERDGAYVDAAVERLGLGLLGGHGKREGEKGEKGEKVGGEFTAEGAEGRRGEAREECGA